MADFRISLKLLYNLEYRNNPKKALDQVKGEDFMTYKGINRKANPKFLGWTIIDKFIKENGTLAKASPICDADPILEKYTQEFYKKNYWDVNHLDKITHQKIADEIFTTGVLTHPKTAAKFAQKTIGVAVDGSIGPITINKLNNYNETLFDKKYDETEINHYLALIKNNSKFKIYEKGWKNRAVEV